MPDIAAIKLETRGATTEIDEYMVTEAKRILNACAAMYDVKVKITMAGAAPACFADKELGHEVAELIEEKCHYDEVVEYVDMGGSEDCGYFMERVQQHGGRALYMMYGTKSPQVITTVTSISMRIACGRLLLPLRKSLYISATSK